MSSETQQDKTPASNVASSEAAAKVAPDSDYNWRSKTLDRPISELSLLERSLLFAELAWIAYLAEESAATIVDDIGLRETLFFERDGSQAYIFKTDTDCIVSCRGTEPTSWNDVKADLNAFPALAETDWESASRLQRRSGRLVATHGKSVDRKMTRRSGSAVIPWAARWQRFLLVAASCRTSTQHHASCTPTVVLAWETNATSTMSSLSISAG